LNAAGTSPTRLSSNWIGTILCVADFEVSIPNALSNATVVDLVDDNRE